MRYGERVGPVIYYQLSMALCDKVSVVDICLLKQESSLPRASMHVQVVVSGGILSLVMWFNSRAQLVHEIERRLTTVAVLRREQLQDYLNGEVDKMQLVATRVQIVNYLAGRANVNESTAQGDLESAVGAVAEFISGAIYNKNGSFLFATNISDYNATLTARQLSLVQNDVYFEFPVHTSTGWKFLLSRNITLVGLLTKSVSTASSFPLLWHKPHSSNRS